MARRSAWPGIRNMCCDEEQAGSMHKKRTFSLEHGCICNADDSFWESL